MASQQLSVPPEGDDGLVAVLVSPNYAPAALRHLRQPVPQDLPADMDGSLFTFEDALEDLLAVSSGRALPDIHTLEQKRALLRQIFPAGEPAWFWLRRLESQGLIQPDARRALFPGRAPDWETFRRELDRRASQVWRDLAGDEHADGLLSPWLRHHGQDSPSSVNDSNTNPSAVSPADSPRRDQVPRGRGADNFDELFGPLSSVFADGQASWDSFVKAIGAASHPSSSDSPDRSRDQVETKRDEHVDRFGYLHRTISRKILDKDGNEVGRETYVTVLPADSRLENASGDEVVVADVGPEKTADKKKSAWFWK